MNKQDDIKTSQNTDISKSQRKKAPWHTAYAYTGGASYNLLPEKLPDQDPPTSFAVCDRFSSRTAVIAEGNTLRWKRPFRKDQVFSAYDIAGVVLGPSHGSNVIYDKHDQILAKFAASMEHADLLFLWLLRRNIPIDNLPDDWRLPETEKITSSKAENPIFQRSFTLRLKRSARIGFAGIGVFLLVLGILLRLVTGLFPLQTTAEWWAVVILELAALVMGIVCLRIGTMCQVTIDGEHMRVVSRLGRTKEFSVREISSVSRSMGWIILYDREWKPLAKLDSSLEHLDVLQEYLTFYGVDPSGHTLYR